MCATLQRARAAGVKSLEDGRVQAKRGVLREGPPSPAGTHGENRVAESRLREIMTTLGVKIGKNPAQLCQEPGYDSSRLSTTATLATDQRRGGGFL
jgi:hypothetical protein